MVLLVMAMLLGATAQSYAEVHGSLLKLKRGVVNCLTGWLEIPKNIYETCAEDNVFLGFTVGIAKGIGMTLLRTGYGVYETVTFPFPIPEEYESPIDPPSIFDASDDNGAPERK